jgi:hypothetical protein
LFRVKAGGLRALDETPVVLVEQLLGQEVHVVLVHVAVGPPREVGMVHSGNVPGADHAFRRGEGGTGVDDRRAAVPARERQGHGPVGGEDAALTGVEGPGHLQLASGEILVQEAGSPLDHEHALAGRDQRGEGLRHGAAARAAAHDRHVAVNFLHAGALHPAADARYPRARARPSSA